MKIHGFNSALPPPDNGKRKQQVPQTYKQEQIDRIELSSGKNPEASYGNRLSPVRAMGNPDSRIEHPTSHISRFHLNSYYLMANAVGGSDPETRFRSGQTALNPVESSPGTESVQTLSSSHRAEKLAGVRLKIAAGYYDNPEFLEKLADVLIDRLNIAKARGSDDVSHNR
jgi:hypothetical protein